MFLVFFCNYRYDMTQIHVEEGKEKKREQRWLKEVLSSREIPHPSPHPTPRTHDAGEVGGTGRLEEGRAHPQFTVRAYLDILSLWVEMAGTTVPNTLTQEPGKRTCLAAGHEGASWRSKDRMWTGAQRPQGWQGDQSWVWAVGPPNIFLRHEKDIPLPQTYNTIPRTPRVDPPVQASTSPPFEAFGVPSSPPSPNSPWP